MSIVKIPKTTKILGVPYKVSTIKQPELGSKSWGEIDHINQTIAVLDIGQEAKEKTFLHEIIHGIDLCIGIDLDETQVERMAQGLYVWLSENGLKIG